MAIETQEHPFWYLEPFEGESISHYLGQFRRQEVVSISSPSSLGRALGLGTAVSRWEKFRFNPFPAQRELEAIAQLFGISVDKLAQLFPPQEERIKLEPIRLCAACYAEAPYHRIRWQFQSMQGCEKHRLRLLSRCPACEEPFPVPALWIEKSCKRCGMMFKTMAKRQISY
jgi:transcriptional regulator with XRE-family HTH domain